MQTTEEIKLYHGSSVEGLDTLTPHVSDHNESYVYFSSNPVVAMFYCVHILPQPYNFFPYGFDANSIPVYTEYYPNAAAQIYSGKRGFLYVCRKSEELTNPTVIPCAFVSKQPIKVEERVEITDVYAKMLEYEQEGRLLIRRYQDLTDKQIQFFNSQMLQDIRKYKLTLDNPYGKFIYDNFQQLRGELYAD